MKQKKETVDLPWFKFFVWDWLNSETIDDFTLEQEAVYLRLCLRQWAAKNGFLPTNVDKLARFARLDSRSRWNQIGRPVLETCFVRKNGHCWNEKLRAHWEEARAQHEANSRAARERWKRERGE